MIVIAPEDESGRIPLPVARSSTAYTVALSTAAHAPAVPGSRAGPRPPPAGACRTHDAAYADAHRPKGRAESTHVSQFALRSASSASPRRPACRVRAVAGSQTTPELTGSPSMFFCRWGSSTALLHPQTLPPTALRARPGKPAVPSLPHRPAAQGAAFVLCRAPGSLRSPSEYRSDLVPLIRRFGCRIHTAAQESPCPALASSLHRQPRYPLHDSFAQSTAPAASALAIAALPPA